MPQPIQVRVRNCLPRVPTPPHRLQVAARLTVSSTFGEPDVHLLPVDQIHAKLVETDGLQLSGGELYQQAAGPFSASSFNEKLAFTLSGFQSGMFTRSADCLP